jgi:hypothetical protein
MAVEVVLAVRTRKEQEVGPSFIKQKPPSTSSPASCWPDVDGECASVLSSLATCHSAGLLLTDALQRLWWRPLVVAALLL